jgi:hypothetical protein
MQYCRERRGKGQEGGRGGGEEESRGGGGGVRKNPRWEEGNPEAEFLDEIQTKVLKVSPLAIHRHIYNSALRFLFLQTHATSYNFYSSVTVHCKGERRKT